MADDEPTGGIETALSITIGDSAQGTIEAEGDIDYYRVNLQAGVTYQFDLEGALTGAGTLDDPFFEGLFDSNNNRLVDQNDDGGVRSNSRIVFTPETSGTYYLAASSFDNTAAISVEQDDTGTYRLFAEEQAKSLRPDPVDPVFVAPSGNGFIDSLAAGIAYAPSADGVTRVTYSIPDANSQFLVPFDDDGVDLTETFVPVASATAGYFEDALQHVSSFANIEFERVQDEGTQFGVLRIGSNSAIVSRVLGVAAFPGERLTAGDIFIFENRIDTASYTEWVVIHELGHALGLVHVGDTEVEIPEQFVGAEFTQMVPQFTSAFFEDAVRVDFFPTTLGYFDMLALRHLYGANDANVVGNNLYQFDLSQRYNETIFDTGGTDTIEIIGSGKSVAIDLTPDTDFLGGSFINVGTTVKYLGPTNATVGSRTETVFLTPETVIENVTASDGDDLIVGNSAINRLAGGAGSDTVKGAAGNDNLFGDAGADFISGGEGNDFISGGDGDDVASGGEGNDRIFAGPTDQGDDIFIGGAGDDVIGGSRGNDLLVGGWFSDGAHDQLQVGSDDPKLDGKDTLFGADGNDTILGGGWDEGLIDDNSAFDVGEQVTAGTDSDVLWAGAGDDLVYAAGGSDVIGARDGSDTVYGAGGDDTIFGGASDHADLIFGEAGNDVLFSGAGNDSVAGGDGDDLLFDSSGDDQYTGGAGADTFVFSAASGNDRITDFSVANDTLDLSALGGAFSSIADIQAVATAQAGGVLLTLSGTDSLLLEGVSLSDLPNLTFVF